MSFYNHFVHAYLTPSWYANDQDDAANMQMSQWRNLAASGDVLGVRAVLPPAACLMRRRSCFSVSILSAELGGAEERRQLRSDVSISCALIQGVKKKSHLSHTTAAPIPTHPHVIEQNMIIYYYYHL